MGNPYGFTIQSQGNAITSSAVTNIVAMTGPGSLVRWLQDAKNYHPDPSTFSPANLDTTVSAVRAAGLRVRMPIHNFSNADTTQGTGDCSSKRFILPSAATTVAAYLANRFNGLINEWESYNEGASDGNGNCNLEYNPVPVMAAIWTAIKSVNPNAIIGGPAFVSAKLTLGISWLKQWLSNIFANGGGQYMSFMNLHYYPGLNTALPTLRQIWQAFQQVAIQYGYPNMRLRISEYGWATGNVTLQQQNDLTIAALEEMRRSGGFIEEADYYTASGSDSFSPYSRNNGIQTNNPLFGGFQAYSSLYPSWPGDLDEIIATRRDNGITAVRRANVATATRRDCRCFSARRDGKVATKRRDNIVTAYRRP